MQVLRQIRAALRHLNPEQVRREAARPLSVELEALAGGAEPPVREILLQYPDYSLALASRFPAFRAAAIERTIRQISGENALFALFTALPSVIPNLVSLGWAAGEFTSDTAVLTANQVRMAFLIAAASGRPVGYIEQKSEIASILAAAFGWRAIARELAGKIPLGEGLIPKAAIAYAGTYAVGRSLEHYHRLGRWLAAAERRAAYREALEGGKRFARQALAQRQ
jgi:uncharacterized protein (DUF697 family)